MTILLWNHLVPSEHVVARLESKGQLNGLRMRVNPRPLRPLWPRVVVHVGDEHGRLLDALSCSPHILVSAHLGATISERCPSDEHELLPVSVRHHRQTIEGYSLLNVLQRIDALDREASIYASDELGRVRWFDRIAIDERRAGRRTLFDLDSTYRVVCVHEELAHAVSAAGCTGVRFVAPRDWTPVIPASSLVAQPWAMNRPRSTDER